MNQVIS